MLVNYTEDVNLELALLAAPDLITPSNYWSLWVPFGLLGLICLAAIYFVQVKIR
ncbi:MAG: hypothetical protein KME16_04850 [Scytolyngbya sp. HA4215-MV1]|nr:hypothetical protein [Scytolyngbya sp. HA4215-MV1]